MRRFSFSFSSEIRKASFSFLRYRMITSSSCRRHLDFVSPVLFMTKYIGPILQGPRRKFPLISFIGGLGCNMIPRRFTFVKLF